MAAVCVALKLRACHRYMTQSQEPDRRLDSKKQSAKNGQETLALSSDRDTHVSGPQQRPLLGGAWWAALGRFQARDELSPTR